VSPRYKAALVTGASSGIGSDLARALAKRGSRLAIVARRKDMLDALAKELGPETVVIEADLTDPDRAVAAVNEAKAALGRLDLVIANAGTGGNRHAAKLRPEHVMTILRLNVLGGIATVTAAIPHMVEQGGGHLVGITSLAGMRGLPTSAAYSASKAAFSVFLESIRIDLKASGIAVTDVRPGFVDTPLTKKNRFPMPFLLTSPEAAERIARAIEAQKRVYAFPWPTATAMRLVRSLPAWLYEWVAGRAPV
jgi:short-subunit dehydrogenase